jgi:hypothetical protein
LELAERVISGEFLVVFDEFDRLMVGNELAHVGIWSCGNGAGNQQP